jgi:hypothetical protein
MFVESREKYDVERAGIGVVGVLSVVGNEIVSSLTSKIAMAG